MTVYKYNYTQYTEQFSPKWQKYSGITNLDTVHFATNNNRPTPLLHNLFSLFPFHCFICCCLLPKMNKNQDFHKQAYVDVDVVVEFLAHFTWAIKRDVLFYSTALVLHNNKLTLECLLEYDFLLCNELWQLGLACVPSRHVSQNIHIYPQQLSCALTVKNHRKTLAKQTVLARYSNTLVSAHKL